MMVLGLILSAVGGWLFTEFYGYWLHKLLHSNKIEFLSRAHMVHHLVDYGPEKSLRPRASYIVSTRGRFNIGGIGIEWILPIGIALAALLLFFRLIHLGALYQSVFMATALAWGYFMFSYMHDAMHVTGFWMEKNPWLSRWFLGARRLHDTHHLSLDDSGRMTKNFGISFYFFDRLFGSVLEGPVKLNRTGVEAAFKRYAFIFNS